MVPAETEPSRRDTNQATKDEIKPEMAIIGEARAAHIDGSANGYKDKDERVNGRRSGLVAVGDYASVRMVGEVCVFGVEREDRSILKIRARGCRGVIGVCAERPGR